MLRYLTLLILVAHSFFGQVQAGSSPIYKVSIYKLLVGADPFIGSTVQVRGYLYKGRVLALYPGKDTAELGDLPSSLEVIDATDGGDIAQYCSSRNVAITGVLTSTAGVAEISEVHEVIDLAALERCWQR